MVKEEAHGSSIRNDFCNLYFKGLVGNNNALAGFGVAICEHNDDPLFQTHGPILGSDVTVLEAELTALKRGLTAAVSWGITHICIYCDYHPLHKLVTGMSVQEATKSGMLLNDVLLLIRERFASFSSISVDEKRIKYAYELAREAIDSQIGISVDPPPLKAKKETCRICFDDDVNADQMFSIAKCHHRFCFECMKRHIEVRLLERSLMRCPHYSCKSTLTYWSCYNLLTPKLKEMWLKKMKEDSIPLVERVYCPNPKCSALMSKTNMWKPTKEAGAKRYCFVCNIPFCIDCNVPWHSNLTCNDYKRLHLNVTANDEKLKALAIQKMWRQCGNCQHMIELSSGCVKVTCRCGCKFCYKCGAAAGGCTHGRGHIYRPIATPPPPPPPCAAFFFLGFLIFFGFIYLIFKFGKFLKYW